LRLTDYNGILNVRTASDLEELGFIDRKEKGLIKDLIISGDKTVQEALDRFAQGDSSALRKSFENNFLLP
jgi:hypothetical protein